MVFNTSLASHVFRIILWGSLSKAHNSDMDFDWIIIHSKFLVKVLHAIIKKLPKIFHLKHNTCLWDHSLEVHNSDLDFYCIMAYGHYPRLVTVSCILNCITYCLSVSQNLVRITSQKLLMQFHPNFKERSVWSLVVLKLFFYLICRWNGSPIPVTSLLNFILSNWFNCLVKVEIVL